MLTLVLLLLLLLCCHCQQLRVKAWYPQQRALCSCMPLLADEGSCGAQRSAVNKAEDLLQHLVQLKCCWSMSLLCLLDLCWSVQVRIKAPRLPACAALRC